MGKRTSTLKGTRNTKTTHIGWFWCPSTHPAEHQNHLTSGGFGVRSTHPPLLNTETTQCGWFWCPSTHPPLPNTKTTRRRVVLASVNLSAPAEHQNHPIWVVLVFFRKSLAAEHQNHLTSGGFGVWWPLVYVFMYLISFNIYYFMHHLFGIWKHKRLLLVLSANFWVLCII